MPIALPILIGAAIADSINPCAFGVLIFLLAFLAKTAKSKTTILVHGLVYILAVFITYLLAGLVLLPVISGLGQLSVNIYTALGALVILAGFIELKDLFWYGKGPTLQLLPGAAQRIKMYTNRISSSAAGAFGLGVFVALVELPCTGAVYLAILSLLALSGVNGLSIFFLLLYNFIFVLPLIIIVFLVSQGTNTEFLESFRKKHRGLARAVIGLTLLSMGIWMVWYAQNIS